MSSTTPASTKTPRRACMGSSGRVTLSTSEADRCWIRCTHCGRILKVRPSHRDSEGQKIDHFEAAVPKHHHEG
jgi:hypothetical protein